MFGAYPGQVQGQPHPCLQETTASRAGIAVVRGVPAPLSSAQLQPPKTQKPGCVRACVHTHTHTHLGIKTTLEEWSSSPYHNSENRKSSQKQKYLSNSVGRKLDLTSWKVVCSLYLSHWACLRTGWSRVLQVALRGIWQVRRLPSVEPNKL